jgi:hypothetical protein
MRIFSMSLVRILAMVGCLLMAGGLSGCGDASDSTTQAPPADAPNAGEAASKSIMNMQPPSPGKKAAHQ